MSASDVVKSGDGHVRKTLTLLPKEALFEKGFEDASKDRYAKKKP